MIKPAYSVSFLLSLNIFVWQNVLYFLDAPRIFNTIFVYVLVVKSFRKNRSVSQDGAHFFVWLFVRFLAMTSPVFRQSGFRNGNVSWVTFVNPMCNPHRGRPGVYIAVYSRRVTLRLALLLRPVSRLDDPAAS